MTCLYSVSVTTTDVGRCPECGAPLCLDDNDRCIYCQAHVTVQAHAAMILGRDWNGDAAEPAFSILWVMYDLWSIDTIQKKVLGQSLSRPSGTCWPRSRRPGWRRAGTASTRIRRCTAITSTSEE